MSLEDTADPSREDNGHREASTDPTGEGHLVVSPTPSLSGESRDGTGSTEACDVIVRYGDTPALSDIPLAIHEQWVTALIGPAGCGNSTFLRCIIWMNDLFESARIEG